MGGHVASPDVHVVQFKTSEVLPGGWYFRVFKYDGVYYGIDRSGDLYRSKDPMGSFEKRRGTLMPGEIRDKKLIRQVRHTAVLREGNLLLIFYSRTGDTPERILLSTVNLSNDWTKWVCTDPVDVIQPVTEYEGIKYPLKTSTGGVAPKQARELRDPGIFEEDGKYYLFYSIAGESGIAMAEVVLEAKDQPSTRGDVLKAAPQQ